MITEMGGEFDCNNIQKHEEQADCKIIYVTRVKGSERRPFLFIFRLNIVRQDSYQVDEIVMEIEEWKQTFPGNYVNSFSRNFLRLLETSIVSQRNCII